MKIKLYDLKSKYRSLKTFVQIIIAILIVILSTNLIASLYIKSEKYEQALSDATEKSVIIIDAGHGGEDCGAIGVNGCYEKDINLSIANELGRLLTEKGFAVVYTRTDDALLYTEEENIYGLRKISDLKNRCKVAAEYPNSLYISIHMNSFKSEQCQGLQVYFSENNPKSKLLASGVQQSVKKNLQHNNSRQIKKGDNIYILDKVKNPAILIECGFLTNPIECEKLVQKEYQKELSYAIFCGIIEYINK